MTKFHKVRSQKGKFSEWMLPTRNHKMACCDCGLVHDMQFKAVKVVGKGMVAGSFKYTRGEPMHQVLFRARRNELSTAAMRRERKKRGAK